MAPYSVVMVPFHTFLFEVFLLSLPVALAEP